MAKHKITEEQIKRFNASYKRCSELLHKIFNEEFQFLENHTQSHSNEAHKAKRELYKELDDIMSYEIFANLSPPSIKTRSPGRQYPPLSSRKRRRNNGNNGPRVTFRNKGPNGTLINNGSHGTLRNNGNS